VKVSRLSENINVFFKRKCAIEDVTQTRDLRGRRDYGIGIVDGEGEVGTF
jgi:hypothetical protein